MYETVLEVDTVFRGTVFTIIRKRVRLPDGSEVLRELAERPDTVLVVPLVDRSTLVLIEEYCSAIDGFQLSFPGGRAEDVNNESLADIAAKELREETGYSADRIEYLTSFYHSPAYSTRRVHVFVATELVVNPLPSEEGEFIKVMTVPLQWALDETTRPNRCCPEVTAALYNVTRSLNLEVSKLSTNGK